MLLTQPAPGNGEDSPGAGTQIRQIRIVIDRRAGRRPPAGLGTSRWLSPGACGPVTVDIDATIVAACSQEQAAAPWEKTFGSHPPTVFAGTAGPQGDAPVSSAAMQQPLGWAPAHPTLLQDLRSGDYFNQ